MRCMRLNGSDPSTLSPGERQPLRTVGVERWKTGTCSQLLIVREHLSRIIRCFGEVRPRCLDVNAEPVECGRLFLGVCVLLSIAAVWSLLPNLSRLEVQSTSSSGFVREIVRNRWRVNGRIIRVIGCF